MDVYLKAFNLNLPVLNKTRLESLSWKTRREYQGLAKKKQESGFVMLKVLTSYRLASGQLTGYTNTLQ